LIFDILGGDTWKERAMSDNPYGPPKTDEAPPTRGELGQIARPTGGMPGTVIAVIVLASIYLLFSLVGALQNPGWAVVQIPIGALILIGLVRRHALAWQWGMIMPIFAAISTLFGVIGVAAAGPLIGPMFVILVVLVLMLGVELGIPVLLSLRRSRLFYGLQCPQCQSMKVKAGNFFFTSFKCRACKAAWRY